MGPQPLPCTPAPRAWPEAPAPHARCRRAPVCPVPYPALQHEQHRRETLEQSQRNTASTATPAAAPAQGAASPTSGSRGIWGTLGKQELPTSSPQTCRFPSLNHLSRGQEPLSCLESGVRDTLRRVQRHPEHRAWDWGVAQAGARAQLRPVTPHRPPLPPTISLLIHSARIAPLPSGLGDNEARGCYTSNNTYYS